MNLQKMRFPLTNVWRVGWKTALLIVDGCLYYKMLDSKWRSQALAGQRLTDALSPEGLFVEKTGKTLLQMWQKGQAIHTTSNYA